MPGDRQERILEDNNLEEGLDVVELQVLGVDDPEVAVVEAEPAVTDIETMLMWSYIWKKAFNTAQGRPSGQMVCPKTSYFWEQYIEETGKMHTAWRLATHYRKHMRFELHMENFRKEQVLWLHKLMAIPLNGEMIRNLKARFNVDLTLNGKYLYGWTDI